MGHIDIECLIYRQSIKMKFVVAFLACIVAAQAATFDAPSYEYWCAHSFHVCPEATTTATDSISTTLGAPVLTTETFSLNSQRALFQKDVKTKRKPITVLMI